MTSNKSEEKYIFKLLNDNLQDYEFKAVIFQDRPDVVVICQITNEKIGIEITKIHVDQSKKGSYLESEIDTKRKILIEICKKLNRNGLNNYLINIHYQFNRSVTKNVKNDLVNFVYKIVFESNKSDLFRNSIELNYKLDRNNHLYEFVDSISIYKDNSITDSIYIESGHRISTPLNHKLLSECIISKECKTKEYEICDTYWLIIYEADFYAGYFDNIELLAEYNYNKIFSKIFIIRNRQRNIVAIINNKLIDLS